MSQESNIHLYCTRCYGEVGQDTDRSLCRDGKCNSPELTRLRGEVESYKEELQTAHQVVQNRDAHIAKLELSRGCLLAGPGRGDCSHFVGLPGKPILGQHDGLDNTVDAYGRPNGWCQVCWDEVRLASLTSSLALAEKVIEAIRPQLGKLCACDAMVGYSCDIHDVERTITAYDTARRDGGKADG